MDLYPILKFVHVLSGAVLLGGGIGIAFFLLWANAKGDIATIAVTLRGVVFADFVFTAVAIVVQPATGLWLQLLSGRDMTEWWIAMSLGLYLVVLAAWLRVVRLQLRMRDLAVEALRENVPVPPVYSKLLRGWFWLGWPALAALLTIYWLMLAKPT